MRSDQVVEELIYAQNWKYCCGQFWTIQFTTHSLVLHSPIYHSLCARHGVRTTHTNSLLPKGSETPGCREGGRLTAFLQRHQKGVQGRCQHQCLSHKRTERELTSQQAGFSLEPKKDFSKQRFVLRDMLSHTVFTFLPSSRVLGLSRRRGHKGRGSHLRGHQM